MVRDGTKGRWVDIEPVSGAFEETEVGREDYTRPDQR